MNFTIKESINLMIRMAFILLVLQQYIGLISLFVIVTLKR